MDLDILSEVLAALELSSRLWFRTELCAPYSVAVPEATGAEPGAIRFHVVREGACVLTVGAAKPVRFVAGDLVLVPHGAAHTLSDAAGRVATPLAQVLDEWDSTSSETLVAGGHGEASALVCGEFTFSSEAVHPFIGSLPAWIHVPATEDASFGWIEQVLEHIDSETRGKRLGHREVARRLSEIALVEALRSQTEGSEFGALAALGDAQLRKSLEAIHADPEANWTLDGLARVSGQSRTLFAEQFRLRLGTTPMKYLASWRMQKASRLLRTGESSIADVASRVGYASESAFARKFREQFGTSPGAYRRRLALA